jgi:hypothetical protein
MVVELDALTFMSMESTYWIDPLQTDDDHKSPSFVEVEIDHPVLTVYTQALAVPEPAPCAMLSAGLAVLGWRRRRRG